MTDINPILIAFWAILSAMAAIMTIYRCITNGNAAYWAIVALLSVSILVLQCFDSKYVIIPLLGLATFYIIMAKRKD